MNHSSRNYLIILSSESMNGRMFTLESEMMLDKTSYICNNIVQ